MNIVNFKGQLYSGPTNLNLLYKTGKTYIMDNHLAAGWCWLQEINFHEKYHLFHIDRHYDLSNHLIEQWVEKLDELNFSYRQTSIEDLLAIQFVRKDEPFIGSTPLFRWDNYITILNELYPDIWETMSFVTQKDGDVPDHYDISEFQSYELPVNLGYWLEGEHKIKSVLNLDIDYFFTNYQENVIQIFSDEYVKVIAEEIRSAWNDIAVFTICLSPECCGGWAQAIRVTNIITDVLGIEWEMKSDI